VKPKEPERKPRTAGRKGREPLTRYPFLGHFTYDDEADAAYIYLGASIKKGGVARTVEVTSDVYADFDTKGRLLGIELLGRSLLPTALNQRYQLVTLSPPRRAKGGRK
jgi:uncharacterized protein YuzE